MPYMAQGAAQATEDAATLSAALREHADLKTALEAYQEQRLPRATHVAKNTRILQAWWHLYDGAEKDRRDELMRHDNLDNPIFWASSDRLDWLFGHDASKMATNGELKPPELASMPAAEELVYNIEDSELRRKFQSLRPWS
jgi:salicylate hydroxylase